MGLRERLFGDKYYTRASIEFDKVQYKCGRTENDPEEDVVGPAMATRIREIYKQSGEARYREALALWQLANAVYPEYVTEKDRPKLVTCLWKNPLPAA